MSNMGPQISLPSCSQSKIRREKMQTKPSQDDMGVSFRCLPANWVEIIAHLRSQRCLKWIKIANGCDSLLSNVLEPLAVISHGLTLKDYIYSFRLRILFEICCLKLIG